METRKKFEKKAYPSKYLYDKYGNIYEVIWHHSKAKTAQGKRYIYFESYRHNPDNLKGMVPDGS